MKIKDNTTKKSLHNNDHRGDKVKEAILSSGKKLKYIAEKLNINRQTLYTKLQNKKISNYYVREIGKIIGYDFSEIFPEIEPINSPNNEVSNPQNYQMSLEKRYAEAVERNAYLYNFIVKLAYYDSLNEVKKKIQNFVLSD